MASSVSTAPEGLRLEPITGDRARELFGQVMAYVAVTVGFAALGAWLGRDLSGGVGLAFFLVALGCVIGLNVAARKEAEQVSVALLFGLGLVLGLAVAPVIAEYAEADPAALWQSAGATAGFVAGCGAFGYAMRRDLSAGYRFFFWALLALIVFGIVALFVAIPNANVVYAVAGLAIFGGFTVLDFNHLRRAAAAGERPESAPLLAAGIFLDIFNVFLFFLELFGGTEP